MKHNTKMSKFTSILLAAIMVIAMIPSMLVASSAEVGDIPVMNSVDSSTAESKYYTLKQKSSDADDAISTIKITLSHQSVYLDKSENMSDSGFTYNYYCKYGSNGLVLTQFSQFVYGPLSSECLILDDNNVQWIGGFHEPPVNYDAYFKNFGQLDPNVIKDREKKSTKATCDITYRFDGEPIKTTGDGETVYLHACAEFGDTYNDNIKHWSSDYVLNPANSVDGIPHFTLYVYDKAPLKTALENAIAKLGKSPVNASALEILINEGKTIYAERAVTDTKVQDITNRLNSFVAQYTVGTAVNDANMGSVSTALVQGTNIDGNIYTEGSVITLTATPVVDYALKNWSGAYSGTDAVTNVTITGNSIYTANFEFVSADYTALNEAIANIPANLSIYTSESVANLNEALAAADNVVAAKYGESNQTLVDLAAKNLK